MRHMEDGAVSMTKAELQKSHDAMARYIKFLCHNSDTRHAGHRTENCEKHYQKARKLLKRAGFKYEPPAAW